MAFEPYSLVEQQIRNRRNIDEETCFRPSKAEDIELFYGVMTPSESEKFVDNLQSLDKPGK